MNRISAGPIEDLPDDHGMLLEAGDHRIAIFRDEEAVYAVADRCSHAEASLAAGELIGSEVECPRHGAIFDLATGAPMSLPATKPVQTYRAEVVDGDVVVTIDGGEPE